MIVSPDTLRRDTVQLITQINNQIAEIEKEAQERGLQGYVMRDTSGAFLMAPLLVAKATAYNTLVMLQTSKK